MLDFPFDPRHGRQYLDSFLDHPVTTESWRFTGPNIGTHNTIYPVVSASGQRGYQKFYTHSRTIPIRPSFRLVGEAVVSRMAVLGGFPVPSNFFHFGADGSSLVSIVPFQDCESLHERKTELTPKEQQQMLHYISALFPFYQWCQFGDFHAGSIILDKQNNFPYSPFAVIDFEDCGPARWLEETAQGKPISVYNSSRTTLSYNVEKFLNTVCKDITRSGQLFHSEVFLNSVRAIETIPAFLIEAVFENLPPKLADAKQREIIRAGLVYRQNNLRRMFVEEAALSEGGAIRLQDPISLAGDPAASEGDLSAHRNFKLRFRLVANEIFRAFGAKNYSAAAATYIEQYDRIYHAQNPGQAFEALNEALLEKDIAVVPLHVTTEGRIHSLYFIHPDPEAEELRDILPYKIYKPIEYDVLMCRTIEADHDQARDELTLIMLNTEFSHIPSVRARISDKRELAIPKLPREMLAFD